MSKMTPMMKQYFDIKSKCEDAILFYRLGDFYEMFFEDAIIASKILEIALTSRSYTDNEKAPMCGVPFHSANSYIQKLIASGKRVAICEQVEDPKVAKGIVRREIIKIISPGTNVENISLEGYKNSYLMSLQLDKNYVYIAYIDINIGDILTYKTKLNNIRDFLYKIMPSEIVLTSKDYNNFKSYFDKNHIKELEQNFIFTCFDNIDKNISKEFIDDFDTQFYDTLDYLLSYIKFTQGNLSKNIGKISLYDEKKYLSIDNYSRKNLELIENAITKQKKNTLFDVLDNSVTSIGKRTLRQWIENPLRNIEDINFRLDIVEEFSSNFSFRNKMAELLNEIYDIERISGKISYGSVNSKDLVALRNSLNFVPWIFKLLFNSNFNKSLELIIDIDDLSDIYNYLQKTILDEPAISIKDGDVIRSEYNNELNEYRNIEKNTSEILQKLELDAREETGIKTLKVGYNKIFGYYFEVTNAALRDANIPPNYIRKQTLTNGERYINEELKSIEDKILSSRQKIYDIQNAVFEEIKLFLNDNIYRINDLAKVLGEIDAYLSLANVSIDKNFIRPTFNSENKIKVKSARHPIIENIIGEDNFVPNDIFVDDDATVQIITGPNMGGKSTYMRQVAILVIMAHMGCFVPAKEADIPILDAIFTRIGASDDLSSGQSTFMVEMKEVSNILENATNKSLIILDEVGRGTSTFDGMSIAWAIIEYICNFLQSTTFFSTHYHEITELESLYKNVKNLYISVEEKNNNIRFMYKLLEGKMDKSYGIHVAKIAGVPEYVLEQAQRKLNELESFKNTESDGFEVKIKNEPVQMSLSDLNDKIILSKIKSLNLDDTTPREAFMFLEKIQSEIK